METFDAKAKRLLKEAGLSYRNVGVKMGYDASQARQVVHRFIHGTNPSAVMVAKFAKALGMTVEKLLKGTRDG